MIIKTLVENTSTSKNLGSEHGLSILIETAEHKLLFDMGKSGLFLKNAEKMGVSIDDVDTAFISHGHYDHGGGLSTFLKINKKAPVYIHEKAFGNYYARRDTGKDEYIGLDGALQREPRIIFTGDRLKINDELELFSQIDGAELLSESNKALLMEREQGLTADSFEHEQNLIITEGGIDLLLCGCSHRGIVNIIKLFKKIKGKAPDFVIGGFHLSNPAKNTSEAPELIEQIGDYLRNTGSRFYTCHCTGTEAYNHLKQILQHNLLYLATGDVVELLK